MGACGLLPEGNYPRVTGGLARITFSRSNTCSGVMAARQWLGPWQTAEFPSHPHGLPVKA
jgi:hypothetical protein